jgi:cell division septal protein FtsQ
MNRRKTIEKPWSLARLLGQPRNRRLRAKQPAAQRPPRDIRAALQATLRGALWTAKALAVLVALGGVGWGGFHGYRRATTSTTFSVKEIRVVGAQRAPKEEVTRLVESLRGRSILGVDLQAARRAVESHPWVKKARIHRELPGRVVIEITEHKAQALLLLGHLYLVDGDGRVFKRANLDEVEGMPVITGIERLEHLNDPVTSRRRIQWALQALLRYGAHARPALSEVRVGLRDQITFYLRSGGEAVRLGNDLSEERLARFDSVWTALGPETRRARVVFLDNEVRADRVTVRMGGSE